MSTLAETPEAPAHDSIPYELTADDYATIVRSGLIPPDRPVYLWDGRLYEKMAKTAAHAAVHNAFLTALSKRLPPGVFLAVEDPVRLDPKHVPLPDLVVVEGNDPLLYKDEDRYPGPDEVLLVVEVAWSSPPADLGPRRDRYATALSRAAYVVVDAKGLAVHVHSNPGPDPVRPGLGRYRDVQTVRAGEAVRLTLGGRVLAPIPFSEILR